VAEHEWARCEAWVVCRHHSAIVTARELVGRKVVGEALCPECQALVDGGRANDVPIYIACGACVRSRFRVEMIQ
jgi:hypothetical protein